MPQDEKQDIGEELKKLHQELNELRARVARLEADRHPERSRGTWACGGAPPVPPGPSTTLGMTSERVAERQEVRQRPFAHGVPVGIEPQDPAAKRIGPTGERYRMPVPTP
ncbi:MAG TPA: hypothetical protein VII75_16690 [Thermoanaerobaculia bacterium]|nr:hypothetical protein [Thermoanaerobaculia bacterium]